MGWSIGWDNTWKRDIGYGVPAYCDHSGCEQRIDRGLVHVCAGEEPRGGDGCGLYFCSGHLYYNPDNENMSPCCLRCLKGQEPFEPKPEHPEWIAFKMSDPSWTAWRKENGLKRQHKVKNSII